VFTQFQNVEPNNLEQFGGMSRRPIVWPDKYKTGPVIYPYAAARR
jgi:branched-chain amino acid transport system substrate-binding protein